MPVRVHRRLDVVVAKAELDLERVRATRDEPRGARMAEVVEAERRDLVRRLLALRLGSRRRRVELRPRPRRERRNVAGRNVRL
jgi:hypothetical protein